MTASELTNKIRAEDLYSQQVPSSILFQRATPGQVEGEDSHISNLFQTPEPIGTSNRLNNETPEKYIWKQKSS
jgi:hypothetical protein